MKGKRFASVSLVDTICFSGVFLIVWGWVGEQALSRDAVTRHGSALSVQQMNSNEGDVNARL